MIELPARRIAVPQSISKAAQATLSAMASTPMEAFPELDDVAGWKRRIENGDRAMLDLFAPIAPRIEHVTAVECRLGGVGAFCLDPQPRGEDKRIVLNLHGGGLIQGGGEVCKFTGKMTAVALGARTYELDYRMPPDHPYPAALDDCIAAYRALLKDHDASEMIVRGSSAGGNLAAALMLRARDENLPFPAALVLATPELDLTESGDSFQTNCGIDVVLKGSLMPANMLYAAGHDLAHPYISPLFGDFGRGFPPTLITTGTRDLFLSNCVRMHNALRRSGNPSELLIEEAMPHVGFFGAPEDAALAADVKAFVDRAWRGEYRR